MTQTVSLSSALASHQREALFQQLHEGAPVARDSRGFWIVSRFDDVRAVLLDHQHFSSSSMAVGMPLISDDPPRHTALRALVNKAFTPSRIAAMQPDIDQLAADLVAAMPEGECEVVEALTSPLPVTVIARMLGVPEADRARFRRWSDAIVGIQDDPMGGERMKTMMELRTYFLSVVAERRVRPAGDLISAVAAADASGVRLPDDQVVGFILLLLIAGNETTTNLLGNMLERLVAMPEQWRWLRAHPEGVDSAIEEALRIDSPAQFLIRVARSDTVVAGQSIRRGEYVLVYLAAANRDPGKWDEPAAFEIERERERHLAFGHGVHFCLGAQLARVEARAALQALLARFVSVKPGSSAGTRLPLGLLYGLSALPLCFET